MDSQPYRPLYPDKVRQRDLVTVCAALARFVRTEGYWPKRRELHARLGCELAALVYLTRELIEYRYVERIPSKQPPSRYMLASRGWEFLGIQPIEPWRKPPSDAVIQKRINAAALRVISARSELAPA